MEVSGATFTNGLLHIDLTRNVPDAIAPQRIAISERPVEQLKARRSCRSGKA
jgi:molecular chaperone IbpB